MNAVRTERLIPRSVVLVRLSEIRYGNNALADGILLSQPTLWRWCDLAGIAARKFEFTGTEFDQLAAIALDYRRGKTTAKILERLIHEQNQQASNPADVATARDASIQPPDYRGGAIVASHGTLYR